MPRTPFERLIMITSVLSEAGTHGRSAMALAGDIGYEGTPESRRDQLSRDIRALRRVGLEIVNVAEPGSEGRWVLRLQDSRVRLAFSEEERAELARAALLSGEERRQRLIDHMGVAQPGPSRAELAVQEARIPIDLDHLMHAVTSRCLVRFEYSGRLREVDPLELEHGVSGWWFRGRERESGRTKTFTVARISHLAVDLPGSAETVLAAEHPSADPLRWEVDAPVEAQLTCPRAYELDVRRLLGMSPGAGASSTAETSATGESPDTTHEPVRLVTRVTNRSLFLARIMELGSRVRLEGPDDLRAELRDRLQAVIVR